MTAYLFIAKMAPRRRKARTSNSKHAVRPSATTKVGRLQRAGIGQTAIPSGSDGKPIRLVHEQDCSARSIAIVNEEAEATASFQSTRRRSLSQKLSRFFSATTDASFSSAQEAQIQALIDDKRRLEAQNCALERIRDGLTVGNDNLTIAYDKLITQNTKLLVREAWLETKNATLERVNESLKGRNEILSHENARLAKATVSYEAAPELVNNVPLAFQPTSPPRLVAAICNGESKTRITLQQQIHEGVKLKSRPKITTPAPPTLQQQIRDGIKLKSRPKLSTPEPPTLQQQLRSGRVKLRSRSKLSTPAPPPLQQQIRDGVKLKPTPKLLTITPPALQQEFRGYDDELNMLLAMRRRSITGTDEGAAEEDDEDGDSDDDSWIDD
jgi:hypothetical protein